MRKQRGDDGEMVAIAGGVERVVAGPVPAFAWYMPGGFMCEREVHRRKVLVFDPPLENGAGEVLGGDTFGEDGREQGPQRLAGA